MKGWTNMNAMRLEFDGQSINEGLARMAISAFAAQMEPSLEELADIKTAVSEGVTNAIVHGYRYHNGKVVMEANVRGDVLTVVIEDFGQGIADVAAAREPFYTAAPEEERAGMGFSIMESFMDSLEVKSSPGEGTRLVMKKQIHKRKGDAA